jgi:hypothetical protein
MLTLQVLDRGRTYLFTLAEPRLAIGSAASAQLRLEAEGVAPVHALLYVDSGAVRLEAHGAVLHNGRPTQAAPLELGDRLEVGGAVLILGRSVVRPAAPEEVLPTPRARPAAVRRPAPRRAGAAFAGIAVAALAVAAMVVVPWLAGDGARAPEELAVLQRSIEAGQWPKAEAHLARLRADWSESRDGRLERLETAAALLATAQSSTQQFTREVLDAAVDRSYAQWLQELQQRERQGTPAERIAARAVRSELRATLERRPKLAAVPVPAVPVPAAGAPAGAQDSAGPAAALAGRLADQGLFAQALQQLQEQLGDAVAPEAVASLQTQREQVVARAQTAAEQVLEAARRQAQAGDPRAAVAQVVGVRHHFPEGAAFAALDQFVAAHAAAAAEAERRRAASPAAVAATPATPATPAASAAPAAAPGTSEASNRPTASISLLQVRELLDQVRAAEQRAAFAAMVPLLQRAADTMQAEDAAYAARLRQRAAVAELHAAWHEALVQALPKGKGLEATLDSGRPCTLRSSDGETLLGSGPDGDVRCTLRDLAPQGLAALVEQVRPTGAAALGAASLLYEAEDAAAAEALLVRLLRAEPGQKEAIDRRLAAGRGEPFDPRGYTLTKDGFQSARSVTAQKDAQKLGVRLAAALKSREAAPREALLQECRAQGSDALAAFAAACQRELDQQLARLQSSTLRKQVGKLLAQREELDKARQYAKDLIYDEVAYFYPYKPPAVSSERFAEYSRVQAEVDRRVDAVRRVWQDDRIKVAVPAGLADDLARTEWLASTLAELGQGDRDQLEVLDWARALAPGTTVGIADFARTAEEREERQTWSLVLAYHELLWQQKRLPAPVREQLKVTNEYRLMFGHRPLAFVPTLAAASQSHAEEMSKLGYFAHQSPTPGRESPGQRMRLCGYTSGVSENIALNDSAQAAHDAWCHSSGHHRNLLHPRHTEMGVGVDGRNWVQNFGAGRVHEEDEIFLKARPRRK